MEGLPAFRHELGGSRRCRSQTLEILPGQRPLCSPRSYAKGLRSPLEQLAGAADFKMHQSYERMLDPSTLTLVSRYPSACST